MKIGRHAATIFPSAAPGPRASGRKQGGSTFRWSAEPDLHLKVITYNIHRAIGVDRRFRPERIVDDPRSTTTPTSSCSRRSTRGRPARGSSTSPRSWPRTPGYPHFALGPQRQPEEGALRQRHPLAGSPSCASATSTSPRPRAGSAGAASTRRWTSPATASGSRCSTSTSGSRPASASKQIELLVRSPEFSGVDPRTTPLLVGGDFNDWRSLLLPVFTNGLGFRCATERKRGPYRCIPTYPSFSPQGGLDRIYHRGPLHLVSVHSCRLQIARVASDHLPVDRRVRSRLTVDPRWISPYKSAPRRGYAWRVP